MHKLLSRLTLGSVMLLGAGTALGQGLPTTQPALVNIVREEIKVGRAADHAKHEAGWPAAYGRAKSPDYYLAMAAMTGPNEVWYVAPYASHAALGESMKRDNSDAVLSTELARLQRLDGEFLNSVRNIQAAARTDLSMGDFPDLTKMRFWEITLFRVRPGHEASFEAAAKAYRSAAQRSAPNTRWRLYEVIAGMPAPTYLVFSSVAQFGEFDNGMKDGQAIFKGATAEELAALDKFSKEGSISVETNRFALDPTQSYVSNEVRASDPAFWLPKKASTRAASAQ
jgi:hypothetical protein